MRYFTIACFALFSLTSCVSTDHVWVENADGNQLKIMHKHTDLNRVIHIENTNRNWIGKFEGGEEKVAERKEFLTALGKSESVKVCAPNQPIHDDDPTFIMVEDDGMAFGGGIIGYAIASAAADYKNLPTAMYYRFSCPQDKKPE